MVISQLKYIYVSLPEATYTRLEDPPQWETHTIGSLSETAGLALFQRCLGMYISI